MHYLTRISHNTAEWHRPTSDAGKHEAEGTYNQKYGFGHEDWLFRSDWVIDGWRYAFLQGVNISHKRLLADGELFDVTLYVIKPRGVRSLVATICDVECLTGQQSGEAVDVFKSVGWYGQMEREIAEVGGNVAALSDTRWSPDILNIRFRLSDVIRYSVDNVLPGGAWIRSFTRYQLQPIEDAGELVSDHIFRGRRGSDGAPSTKPYTRRPTGVTQCTPEHARMQAKLLAELRVEYPSAQVECEKDYIDVSVQTDTETLLFELKSDLNPRNVIRLALGQLLEYAYYPGRDHGAQLRLVIVGRKELSPIDQRYFDHLTQEFKLPLEYRVVSV